MKNEIATGGKMPPQSIEIEEAVLGALMIDKEAINTVIDILSPESFYKPAHQEVYKAIFALFARTDAIDMLTVTQELRKMGKIDMVGGAVYVMRLTDRVSSAANIETHARNLSELAIKRELIGVSGEVLEQAFSDESDAFELVEKLGEQLMNVIQKNAQRPPQTFNKSVAKTLLEIKKRKNMKDGLTGVPSGFFELDSVTAGWQNSDLVIVAARPAMGKTAFALSLVRHAAIDFQLPVAIFSLEMSETQLTERILSADANLDSNKIKRPNTLEEFEWKVLEDSANRISAAPIYMDDSPALTINALRAKCRRLKIQHGIKLIVVDYLQLMAGANHNKQQGNREQEIATISRGLKSLAKELDVPIVALSQLSRAVEARSDKRPQLSDLRESGAIEADADMVLFLHRPEYYGITQDLEGNPTAGTADIIIAKHRNGALKDVRLRFIAKFTKFENNDALTFSIPKAVPNADDAMSSFNSANGVDRKTNEPPF